MSQQVWRDYYADRISLVSALLRVEQLLCARIVEIKDWDALDWTTSPLEPRIGVWSFDGDRLICGADDSTTVIKSLEEQFAATADPIRKRHIGYQLTCARLHAAGHPSPLPATITGAVGSGIMTVAEMRAMLVPTHMLGDPPPPRSPDRSQLWALRAR